MDHPNHPIDEYTLAAFLAGTLSQERRSEVAAYLAGNPDARELLCMAHEALEAAHQPAVAQPFAMDAEEPTATQPAREATARAGERPAASPLQRLRGYAATALAAVVLAVGLYALSGPSTDALRSSAPAGDTELTVRITTPALQFEWTKIPDAYYYRLVIFDPDDIEVVAQHETRETRLGRDDAFVLSLASTLTAGHTYTLSVEAVDVQNRGIQRSERIPFILPE